MGVACSYAEVATVTFRGPEWGVAGEGAVDDEVGVVELPWLDRAWCGQGGCVGPRRGEGQRHGVAVVSVPCRGRQHGGGRRWAVGKGLKVLRA